ncbi:MAG: Crp/Fnr family transcriptional regulator [Deltaproteobacteria bacterium]|nr:Crp/Fnr family transcriptional regulator [Deltaproteobacteria bacterium]
MLNCLPLAESETYSAACPDCPGGRLGVLREIIGNTKHECSFETAQVAGRAFVPSTWVERHSFGLIRRGVLIRQRLDETGAAIAVDAAGPGCMFPIDPVRHGGESVACDYAATDLIVCLCPARVVEEVLGESTTVGRDLLALQAAALDRVERLAQARGASTTRRRVASLLVALCDTLSPPRTRERLPPGLQQRDMAKLLGIRHESFCRALRELENDGAIAREASGIALVDRTLL